LSRIHASIQGLLVVGVDSVSVATSARKAGYKVYAADYFGDLDLKRACSAIESMVHQKPGKSSGKMRSKFKPETFLKMARRLITKFMIDAIVLSSGLDDNFDMLCELDALAPILGNSPQTIEKVRRKPEVFEELESLGIAHPETAVAENLDEAEAKADEIGYPLVIKPVAGFGGVGVRIARDSRSLQSNFSEVSAFGREVVVQKLIGGVHASISFLSTSKHSTVLTVNEQLLGLPFLFQPQPFGYCGNVVPLRVVDSLFEKCRQIVHTVASHFELRGSNGIDVVISEDGTPYVIEVNPRFQGTLECVERALGINIVESHINACLKGSLPTIEKQPATVSTRLVLYAPNKVKAPDLTTIREARDIPLPASIVEKSEPVCSIVTEGRSRGSSFNSAKKLARSVYSMLSAV